MAGRHDHPHEHFGPGDSSLSATGHGVRATWISLGVLGATALVQLAIVALTGSVALLADTIHNATDALTAIPLCSRSVWDGGRRVPATPTVSTARRTSPASRSC